MGRLLTSQRHWPEAPRCETLSRLVVNTGHLQVIVGPPPSPASLLPSKTTLSSEGYQVDLTWVRISQLCGAGSARIKSKTDKKITEPSFLFSLKGYLKKLVWNSLQVTSKDRVLEPLVLFPLRLCMAARGMAEVRQRSSAGVKSH